VVGLADRIVGGEVVAGGERGPGAAQDRDPDRGIGVGGPEGLEDRAAQLVVERVALLRAVEGQAADAGVWVVEQQHRHGAPPRASWARTARALAVSMQSLLKAVCRGRYFMPQSGARISRSGATRASPARIRAVTCSIVSTAGSARSITPRMMVLPDSSLSTARSSLGCAASIEICWAMVPASWGRNE